MGKRVSMYGIFAALAILMGYIEFLVPIPIPVPGIKLGLANVIVLLALYIMGYRAAFFVSLVRLIMSALLFSGVAAFLYSAAGALLSFLVMSLCKKTNILSIVGISVIGAIAHNVGQIGVASIVMQTPALIYYLPVLLISAVITGVATGAAARLALKHLENSL